MNLELIMSFLRVLNVIVCLWLFVLVIVQFLHRTRHSKIVAYLVMIIFGSLNASLFFDFNFDGLIILTCLLTLIYLTRNQLLQANYEVDDKKDSTFLMLQAKEQERSRIYANLHDDVGAKLLELVYTAKDEASKILAKEVLTKMRQAVASTENIQCNVEQLVDSIMTESAMRFATASIDLNQTIQLDNPEYKLSTTLPMTVLRIIREVVSNIIKHSRASIVNIHIQSTTEQLIIIIKDNGTGMKFRPEGKGLQTIEKRAQSISAQTKIASSPGQGTLFELNYNYEHK